MFTAALFILPKTGNNSMSFNERMSKYIVINR